MLGPADGRIQVIDSHTGGEPTRVVMTGVPDLGGGSVARQLQPLRAEHDWLRRTVVNEPPQVGEFVGPQPAGISVDMGGIRIADFSTLLVETDIPETRLAQVRPGGPAEIVLDAFPSRRLRGEVKEITPEVDRAKATVMVKVAFVDPIDGVLPDMSARVSFLAEALDADAMKEPPKTVVPGSAITERGGGQVVFVIENGQVKMVPVQLGPAFGSGYELRSGPRPGTRVVASPDAQLKDGQKIKEASES